MKFNNIVRGDLGQGVARREVSISRQTGLRQRRSPRAEDPPRRPALLSGDFTKEYGGRKENQPSRNAYCPEPRGCPAVLGQ